MANGFTNFMNGLANGAKSVVMDPLVDLGALAAKGVNMGVSKLAGTDYKSGNKAIDEAAEGIKNEMVSKVDPTSTAGAIGEGIPVGLANADAVVSLAELAKNLTKAGMKQLPKLLSKYQNAKDKKAQLEAAQKIRDFINLETKAVNTYKSTVPEVTAPAYQQKASANLRNLNGKPTTTFVEDPFENPFPVYNNMTSKYREAPANTLIETSKITNPNSAFVPKSVKKNFSEINNKTTVPLNANEAADLNIPYGGTNMSEVKEVQKTVDNIAKMSNKDFKEFMQNAASSDTAGYGRYWYDSDVDDLWKATYNSPNDYGDVKEAVIDRIINHHGLDQEGTLTSAYQNSIKSNLLNNKSYRTWKKKSVKNAYDKDTYGTTRKELRDDAMNSIWF